MTLVNAFGAIALDSSVQSVKTAVDSINTKTPTQGQTTMSASSPVVIASNQTAIPVTGTFFQTTQPISAATLPLPSGAATEATLSSLNGKVTAVNTGAVTISAALPAGANSIGSVSVSNFPATQAISAASLPLPTGAATETTLSSLSTKIPAQGQAVMSASQPVAIASDQSNLPTFSQALTTTSTIVALNGSVTLNTQGSAGVAIDLRGTFVATVTFQGTIDGTNFFNLQATPAASANNVAPVTTATAPGAWMIQCAGCVQVRATATAFTSGTITAVLRATNGTGWVYSATVGANNAVTITGASNNVINTPVTPTSSFINSAATTNATSVKATAGTVWSIIASNINAAARYVKFYNLTVAPTVGTSVPAFTILIPAGSTVQIDGGANGIWFGTGIALAITTGMADSDVGAVAANEIKISTQYT